MLIKTLHVLILTTFALLITSTYTFASKEKITGVWYGEFRDEGYLRLSIAERSSDNTFKVTFYKCDQNGLTHIASEYGSWGYSDGFYLTNITMIEYADEDMPQAVTYFEKYRILETTDNFIKYQNVRTQNTYTNTRTDKDHKLLCQELMA